MAVIIYIFLFLYPFFFLPLTSDIYEYNKMYLFVLFTILLFIFSSIDSIKNKKIIFSFGSYGIPLILISLISLISLILRTPNPFTGLLTPMSASTFITGTILYFMIQNSTVKEKNISFLIISLSSAAISVYFLLSVTGIIPPAQFTPAGSISVTLFFLLIVLSGIFQHLLAIIMKSEKVDDVHENHTGIITVFYSVAFFIILFSIVFIVSKIFSDSKPVILPLKAGMQIFLETMKNISTFLLGIGPSNFITAYTFSKPVWLNDTVLWNINFSTSSSFLLTLATETGVISAVCFISIVIISFRRMTASFIKSGENTSVKIYTLSAFLGLVFLTVFPSGMAVFITVIILLAFSSSQKKLFIINSPLAGYARLFLSLILMFSFLYFGGKAYRAEMKYKKALDIFAQGKMKETYELLQSAITLNPYMDRYHVVFSQSSLALANALNSQKDLTDKDRESIPKLIQQSLEEAKYAVNLYKTNIANWDNLGKIYSSLINVAKGAEDWAVQTQKQELVLDPANPSHRLNLGGIYYSQNNFTEAEKYFRDAVSLKKDFGNARFNLALSLISQKKYPEAYAELLLTQNLTASGSGDRKIVEQEIEKLLKEYSPVKDAPPAAGP